MINGEALVQTKASRPAVPVKTEMAAELKQLFDSVEPSSTSART